MLETIIRHAVEAAFSEEEFEKALAYAIAEEINIDYNAAAEEALALLDLSETIQEAANDYAKDYAIDILGNL